MSKDKTAVILMTYGSATTAEHVPAYLEHIYRSPAPQASMDDFQKRYRLIGYSPLIDITHEQASLLERELDSEGLGEYVVRAAMLHSAPFISDVVEECQASGATKLIGIILSPQFSSFIMEGYKTALKEAGAKHGFAPEDITVAEPWPTEQHFVTFLATQIKVSLEKLQTLHGTQIPLIFTTHSLPERVVAKDPSYLDQLKATTDAVLEALKETVDVAGLEHYSAYQSAGHTPEPWLKPDLTDILVAITNRAVKAPAVLIVPIQFLANHLEILYDLDIAGAEQCAEHGIAYNRTELPNTNSLFIKALAAVAKNTKN